MKGNAFLHWVKFYLGIDNAITQTSFNEQELLKRYAQSSKLIAEIGVFEGVNTVSFAQHSPSTARIYAIDPFFKGAMGINYGKYIARSLLRRSKVMDKVLFVEGLSWNVADKVADNLDLIFIDGDHSFEGVKKDFEIYNQKLAERGVIIFHDARVFENGWTKEDWGPVQLVNKEIRTSKAWKIIEELDSIVVVGKV